MNNSKKDLNRIERVKLEDISVNQNQPRLDFDDEILLELGESIKTYGVIQPIIVRRITRNKYEIIAGERRYRASKLIGRERIPAIVLDVDEEESAKIALVENIQREDLNPVEEAKGYKRLIDEFNISQGEISDLMGKSRSYISNSIRLLNLDTKVLGYLKDEKISIGHGKALLGLKEGQDQQILAGEIIDKKLSVRQTEAQVKAERNKGGFLKKKQEARGPIDTHRIHLEEELMEAIGTRVKIVESGSTGRIEIEYYTEEDLNRIYELIMN